jgi:thiamine-phosphate pyrophosphorylase
MPLVAVGGIGADNIAEVVAAGAPCVAVVSAVVCADDMEAATRELAHAFPNPLGVRRAKTVTRRYAQPA